MIWLCTIGLYYYIAIPNLVPCHSNRPDVGLCDKKKKKKKKKKILLNLVIPY